MSTRRKARGALVSAVLALLLVLLAPARAAAWGQKGHVIVAHIASKLLTDKAGGVVEQLLQDETMESVATWADGLRGTYKNPGPRPETSLWHFVDIPRAEDYDAARDCTFLLNGPCVVVALYGVELVLADPDKKGYYQNSRYEALKYAIHLAGDMHQPLHCIDDNDHGGNSKKVRWTDDQIWKFHAVWDDAILDENIARAKKADPNFSKTGDDAVDYAEYLYRSLNTDQKNKVIAGAQPHSSDAAVVGLDVLTSWARETHKLAQAAYNDLPAPQHNVYDLSNGGYYDKHSADVNKQLVTGAMRLALILNETLKK
jgi:hypothetical protein